MEHDKRMIREPARRLNVGVTQLALGRRDDEVLKVGCAANVLDHVERHQQIRQFLDRR